MMHFWHLFFILQFPIKIKVENTDNPIENCNQNNLHFSTQCSIHIFNRKVVINKFRILPEENVGSQTPLRSICLRCSLCLTIAEKFDKIFNFMADKQQDYNQVKIVAILKKNLHSLCLNGFQKYDLRKHKNGQILTDRFTCSTHIRTKLDGQWTKSNNGIFRECRSLDIPLNIQDIICPLQLLWALICVVAASGAIAIAYSNWTRYLANPTVVSLQKDFRNWQNFFPAVTGCFIEKADKKKTEKLIFEKWGINNSHPTYPYYSKFVKIIANVSYANLIEFSAFENDTTLNNLDFFEIAHKVHPYLSGTLVTFEPKLKTNWTLIMSEVGLCFTVNSKFVHFMDTNYKSNRKNWKPPRILRCHYLNGLCYARYDSDPQLPLMYYVHSYLDVVHATIEPPLIIHESEELEINYRMQETESSPSLRYLSPLQRRCRFFDEPMVEDVPFYSTSICYIMCRYKLVMKLCGCRPFFYHNLGGKLCTLSGLACIAKHAKNITKPPSELGCQCPQACDIMTYFPQVPKLTKWENGYFDQRITFRWGLLPPTTKFHRDILFGFEDLVVSFGGTLALFLGFSFISAIETIFLIIDNIYIYNHM